MPTSRRTGTTTFATFYLPGASGVSSVTAGNRLEELRNAARAAAPPGVTTSVTGIEALHDSQGAGSEGSGVLIEALIGGAGALLILLFVFGTLPAVVMPLLVALASILNTFTPRVDPHLLHVGFARSSSSSSRSSASASRSTMRC